MRHIILRGLLPLAAVIVAAFVLLKIAGSAGDLASLPRIDRPWLLVPALFAQAATIAAYVALWRALLFAIDPARPARLDSAAAFACSWLARHAPTGIPYVAGKVVLGERLGHARTPVIASMLYENLFVVCVFAATSAVALAFAASASLIASMSLAVALAAAVPLVALPLPITRRIVDRAARAIPRANALSSCHLSVSATVRGATIASAAAIVNGAAFALLLNAFVALSPQEMLIAAAAFNLAGAAGVAAVPVPSGIGVREAVLIALLQPVVPLEVATAAAVVARAGGLALDLTFGLGGAALIALRARRGSAQVRASYSPSPLSSRPS
jgi:uncharacterized membrane protein YbhN (UPF0104 family)